MSDAVGQILDAIDLGRRAAFEQEIAVGRLLPGNRIQDEQRLAHRQRLGRGQAAGLGDDEVGHGHQFVHVGRKAEHVRRMLAVVRGEFAAQFLVAAGDDQRSETGLRHLVQFGQDFARPAPCRIRRSTPAAPAGRRAGRNVCGRPSRPGFDGKFRGDGNARRDGVFRGGAARDQPRLGFLGGDAIQIHARVHPQRVRLEIRHDADDERPDAVLLFPQRRERFERQVMRAKHHVGLELLHVAREALLGAAGKFALEEFQVRELWIVGLGEHHAPKLRRAFDKLDVAFGVNFPVQGREQLQQVDFFDNIVRAGAAPGFLQRGGSGDVPRRPSRWQSEFACAKNANKNASGAH